MIEQELEKENYRISVIWNKLVAHSTIGNIDDIIFPFYRKGIKEGKAEAKEEFLKDLRRIFNILNDNGHEYFDKWLKMENYIIQKEEESKK